jgi:hypothetical protein
MDHIGEHGRYDGSAYPEPALGGGSPHFVSFIGVLNALMFKFVLVIVPKKRYQHHLKNHTPEFQYDVSAFQIYQERSGALPK